MARKHTQGWYYFADGTAQWTMGFSAQERGREVRQHGKIVRFEPTYF